MKRYLLIFLILVLLLLNVPIFSEEKLNLNNFSELTSLLPKSQEYLVQSYYSKENKVYTYTYKVLKDQENNIIIQSLSDVANMYSLYNNRLQLNKGTIEFKSTDVIKELEYDKLESYFDEKEEKVILTSYLSNKEVETKKTDYSLEAIDINVLSLYLQGFLLLDKKHFNADLNINGKTFNVKFTLNEINNIKELTTANYEYPTDFLKHLENKKMNIFIMEATGAVRLIYPHKFYFVFYDYRPYNLIAYWGGAAKEAEYRIYNLQ